jgi:glycerate-2-kinase
MLLFESQARTIVAYAVIFHTGHPCPDEKRPASMQAALRVFSWLRQFEATHSNS